MNSRRSETGTRRALLAAVGAGAVSLAGCVSAPAVGGPNASCLDRGSVEFAAERDRFEVVTGDHTVETLAFTLRNRTSCPLTVDTGAWRIERESGGEWNRVAGAGGDSGGSGSDGGNGIAIPGGGKHRWSLSLTPHPTPRTDDTTYVWADLPEGTYRFVVTGTLGDERISRRAGFTLVKRTASPTTEDASATAGGG
ncbi:MAG: hypothetical protein ABEJ28_07010 [Salinigranum sp.]